MTIARRLGSYLLALGLIVGGAAALAITLKINFHFGSGLAVTETGAELQGLSSLVVDVMAALLALATGALLRKRHRIIGVGALLLTLCFGAYSLTSAVGFGAAERLSLAEGRRLAAADGQARAKAVQDARIAYVEWLKRTATSRPKDAKTLIEATSNEIDKLAKGQVAAPTLLPDAQAAAFAHLTSIDQERIQLWLVVALASLLVLGKIVGFTLGAFLWPSATPPPPASDSGNEEETPPVSANENRPVDMAAERQRRMVSRFLREETKADPKSNLNAMKVYEAFRTWTKREGYLSTPSQALFGRICTELGVAKIRGDRVRYAQLALTGDQGPKAAFAA